MRVALGTPELEPHPYSLHSNVRENTFTDIYSNKDWSAEGDGSGSGSEYSAAVGIRTLLMRAAIQEANEGKRFVLVDAACGACKWTEQWLVDLKNYGVSIDYTGYDITQEAVCKAHARLRQLNTFHNIEIHHLDIADVASMKQHGLTFNRRVSVLLCRDLLQHLCYYNAALVLEALSSIPCDRFLFTTYASNVNTVIIDGAYYPINLSLAPFLISPDALYAEDSSSTEEGQKFISEYNSTSSLTQGSENALKIPHILHRMWLNDSHSDTIDGIGIYDAFNKTFEKHNPEMNIMQWRNADVKTLWEAECLKPYIDLYESVSLIEKCDLTRYAIMYLYGGVYVDLNTECISPLSPVLSIMPLILVKEPSEHEGKFSLLSNSFLASCSGHPFWLSLLAKIKQYYYDHEDPATKRFFVTYNTGPAAFYKHATSILSPVNFDAVTALSCQFQPLRDDKSIRRDCDSAKGPAMCIKHWWNTASRGYDKESLKHLDIRLVHKQLLGSSNSHKSQKSHIWSTLGITAIIVLVMLWFADRFKV
jgi:mannosyltransferase OCH1-like enzyme